MHVFELFGTYDFFLFCARLASPAELIRLCEIRSLRCAASAIEGRRGLAVSKIRTAPFVTAQEVGAVVREWASAHNAAAVR